jgi:phosphate transport system substrate-binding protein
MGGPIDAVAKDPDALAYSVYFYEEFMNKNPANRLLAIDGVLPTRQTIADRTYPLTADVFVVTRKDLKADNPAAKVRDWLLSPAGQRLVADSGYVPIR